jgi:hypothetical protein
MYYNFLFSVHDVNLKKQFEIMDKNVLFILYKKLSVIVNDKQKTPRMWGFSLNPILLSEGDFIVSS